MVSVRVRRRQRRQAGFTLVEVLVSLILSTIAMIGVIALYRAQTTASSFSRRSTEATVLAEDQMERLRTQVGLTTGTDVNIDETGKPGGVFTRQYDVTNGGTFFDMVVKVTWTEEGNLKTVTLRGRRNQ